MSLIENVALKFHAALKNYIEKVSFFYFSKLFTFWKFSFKTNLLDVLVIDFFPVFHHKEITHHINPLNIYSLFLPSMVLSVSTPKS